jgi:hypothetical protein
MNTLQFVAYPVRDLDAAKAITPLDRYPAPVSSHRVPGGVVHKLPGDLRKALIANPTALDALEGRHASGSQGVHLLGRGCQAAEDPRAPHSPDPRGAGGRPASTLLLAGVQAPRTHRQIAARRMSVHHLIIRRRRARRRFRSPALYLPFPTRVPLTGEGR